MSIEAVARLLAVLDVQRDGDLSFSATPSSDSPHRLFGGLVVAQALVASGRTVSPDRPPHALHAHFLGAGDPTLPLTFSIDRLRDGRAFSTRQTTVSQGGRPILHLVSSFHDHEDGLELQDSMPSAPEPDALPDWHNRLLARVAPQTIAHVEWDALDMRCDDRAVSPAQPNLQVWLRTSAIMPSSALLNAAVLTYATDLTMLAAVPLPNPADDNPQRFAVASLDHSTWFHRPLRVDSWLLHDQHSPGSAGGRSLVIGRVFRSDGVLVASTAQEGLLRPQPSQGAKRDR